MTSSEIVNMLLGGGFVIGAIFWAGATYSRIGRIEKDLAGLVKQLEALAHLETMKARLDTHDNEIVMLRKSVFGDRWRQFGGVGKAAGDS